MARRSAVGQGLRYGSAYVDTTEICSLRYNCRSGPGAIRALRPKRAHLFRNQRSSPDARAIPIGRASLMAFGTILRSRSEEHTSELQSLMHISSAVFCLK